MCHIERSDSNDIVNRVMFVHLEHLIWREINCKTSIIQHNYKTICCHAFPEIFGKKMMDWSVEH